MLRPQNDLSWFFKPFLLAMITAFRDLARLSMDGSNDMFTNSATNTLCRSTSSSERYAPLGDDPTVPGSIPTGATSLVSTCGVHASARPVTGSRAPFTGRIKPPPFAAAPIEFCIDVRKASRSASLGADGDDASCTNRQCLGTSASASVVSLSTGGNTFGSSASLLYASAGSSPGLFAMTA